MSGPALAPIVVGVDMTPADHPSCVATLFETTYAELPANTNHVTREKILDTYERLAKHGKGDIFLESFIKTTAQSLAIALPTMAPLLQRDGLKVVMVPRNVLEAGIREWLGVEPLQELAASEARSEP